MDHTRNFEGWLGGEVVEYCREETSGPLLGEVGSHGGWLLVVGCWLLGDADGAGDSLLYIGIVN